MALPGVHIETLRSPTAYAPEEIEMACRVAAWLHRGKLVLCVEPKAER